MPKIEIETKINASREVCFNLASSIDFHQVTSVKTKEKAIAGKTSGFIKLNDEVNWEAVHLKKKKKLCSRITEYSFPNHFRDVQVFGAFKAFKHDHYFKQMDGYVIMTDVFDFESPLGIIGKLFNHLVLTKYMTSFLTERNQMIKKYAESEMWRNFFLK